MDRKSFFGSLAALVVAPKSIALSMTKKKAVPAITYSYTDVKTVSKYISGYVRVSKQMMKDIPWLQTRLPEILLKANEKREKLGFEK